MVFGVDGVERREGTSATAHGRSGEGGGAGSGGSDVTDESFAYDVEAALKFLRATKEGAVKKGVIVK